MKGLQNLFNLFYPDVCVCCDQYLVDHEACCIELLKVENLKISVVTIALTE